MSKSGEITETRWSYERNGSGANIDALDCDDVAIISSETKDSMRALLMEWRMNGGAA